MPPVDLSIRDAVPGDLPAIAAIYAHAVLHGTASWEIESPDLAELTRRFETIIAGGYPYLVAERSGRILGYAYAGAYRPRPAYRATVENSIYVAPDAQGSGIGSALLGALVETCTARGFRQMIAVIGDGNGASIGSQRLHSPRRRLQARALARPDADAEGTGRGRAGTTGIDFSSPRSGACPAPAAPGRVRRRASGSVPSP